MEALKVALETVLVGALTLPVLYIVCQLLVRTTSKEGDLLAKMFSLAEREMQITAVLFFVAAYVLGAIVSRVAEDFFNDDDNIIKITEDKILVSAYCYQQEPWPVSVVASPFTGKQLCSPSTKRPPDADSRGEIVHIFQVEESSLLLLGEAKTDKLHLLHQQIMVLRGTAFDGLLASILSLFGWLAKREERRLGDSSAGGASRFCDSHVLSSFPRHSLRRPIDGSHLVASRVVRQLRAVEGHPGIATAVRENPGRRVPTDRDDLSWLVPDRSGLHSTGPRFLLRARA